MKDVLNFKNSFFILITLIFLENHTYGQNIKEIDSEFVSKNMVNKNESYINIYLNSNDCYRCFGEIHQILNTVEKEKDDTQINILTDQIVFAKKNTKDYSVNKKFYIEHDIFQKAPQSFYYYKYNGQIISDFTEIIGTIDKSNNVINNIITSIQIKDSLFTSDNLMPIGKLDNLLLVYDQSVDLGGVINIKNADIDYFESTTISEKLYSELPFKTYKDNFELVNHNDFQNIKNNFPGISEIKITSIRLYKNTVFTQFMVNRLFLSTRDNSSFELPSFTYLAVKNINNKNLSSIFDIDSYEHFFNTDILPYKSTDYRIGVSINYPYQIINEHKFKAKIFNKLDYSGEATFELTEDYSKLNITSIDSEAPRIYDYYGLKIDGKEYYVDKEMTNESTGEGIITLKERVIHQ